MFSLVFSLVFSQKACEGPEGQRKWEDPKASSVQPGQPLQWSLGRALVANSGCWPPRAPLRGTQPARGTHAHRIGFPIPLDKLQEALTVVGRRRKAGQSGGRAVRANPDAPLTVSVAAWNCVWVRLRSDLRSSLISSTPCAGVRAGVRERRGAARSCPRPRTRTRARTSPNPLLLSKCSSVSKCSKCS